ncbi:hypothetical protein L596_026416 [Steinernema carpocapsae]|uniref:PDZ domain-containing protein n=1 Tax=Steinernema carpocapsae TaxID=34508 RepID=A0A4U5M1A8_STECR|nr:hypothetical protein L596_026416 [Steinernema carpocapsae]
MDGRSLDVQSVEQKTSSSEKESKSPRVSASNYDSNISFTASVSEGTDEPDGTVLSSVKEDSEIDAEVAAEVAKRPPRNRLHLVIPHEKNLRLTFTKELTVEKVPRNCGTFGKLRVGDIVLAVNKHKVTNLPSLRRAVYGSDSPLQIVVDRPLSVFELTPARARNLNVDLDTTQDVHFIFYLWFSMEKPLGLYVRSIVQHESVVVSRVAHGSLCNDKLKPGDFILDVNGVPCHHKIQAKREILNSLVENSWVSIACRRPTSASSIALARQILGKSALSKLDPRMPVDAAAIGRREALRRNARLYEGLLFSPILRAPKKEYGNVTFEDLQKKNVKKTFWSMLSSIFPCLKGED